MYSISPHEGSTSRACVTKNMKYGKCIRYVCSCIYIYDLPMNIYIYTWKYRCKIIWLYKYREIHVLNFVCMIVSFKTCHCIYLIYLNLPICNGYVMENSTVISISIYPHVISNVVDMWYLSIPIWIHLAYSGGTVVLLVKNSQDGPSCHPGCPGADQFGCPWAPGPAHVIF